MALGCFLWNQAPLCESLPTPHNRTDPRFPNHRPLPIHASPRLAKCALPDKLGQPITKPLFCRHLDWLARSSKLDYLANQSNSKRGSGVRISRLAPPAPSIPDPTPRPILKFERPTPISNPPHPKNATTTNQATVCILTTPHANVNTICRKV